MSNKTAVEFLIDELCNHIAEGTLDALAITRLRRQAKDLEKCQIIEAFMEEKVKWLPKIHDDGSMSISNEIAYENGEDYYNQRYK
jgi:hypothetical protein